MIPRTYKSTWIFDLIVYLSMCMWQVFGSSNRTAHRSLLNSNQILLLIFISLYPFYYQILHVYSISLSHKMSNSKSIHIFLILFELHRAFYRTSPVLYCIIMAETSNIDLFVSILFTYFISPPPPFLKCRNKTQRKYFLVVGDVFDSILSFSL